MNRTHRVVRASFYLSLSLPLAALACGQSFTAGPGDGGEETGIIFGDGGPGQDATSKGDGATDARQDGEGPRDAGADHDATTTMDGMAETGPSCGPGMLTCSDGGCVPESPTNCGACGNDCTMLPHVMGAQCNAGQCSYTCDPGWQNCTGTQGAGCPTNVTQQGNCGACDVTCSGNTPVCSGTGCVSACDAGTMLCMGTCANTQSDPQNCNGCGNVCDAGPPSSQPTCSNGMCSFACDNGYTNCSGSCFDLNNDPNHCGLAPAGCTTSCSGITHGQAVCTNGMCGTVCDTGYETCSLSSGTSCILYVPDTTHGLFVAPPPAGQPSSCGSEAIPCDSISAALPYLVNGKNVIYVEKGTYADQVTLPAGVTIQGNWVDTGGQWSRECVFPSETIIQALPGKSSVFIANYAGGPAAVLDTLTIVNQPSAPMPSQSIYGLLANGNGTLVQLENVNIQMGTAGSGTNGMTGSPGSGTTCGSSSNGAQGGWGTAGPPGSYGSGGYQSGGTGGTGLPGHLGTQGGNGSDGGTCTITTCQIVCGDPPGCTFDDCTSPVNGGTLYGGTGSSGCPGNPGDGGTGGTGGGASIGVYAWGAGTQVTATAGESQISAGTGGAGGPGGGGGAGAAGMPGKVGSPATCSQGSCSGAHATSCTQSGTTTAPGGAGGSAGGDGGAGGQGGGGHGGDSYCYYAGNGAVVMGNISCSTGTAGSGGAPNGTSGDAGVSGP